MVCATHTLEPNTKHRLVFDNLCGLFRESYSALAGADFYRRLELVRQ